MTAAPSASPSGELLQGVTPAVPAENDDAAVELGVRFRATADVNIIGVQYYKSASNSGVHVGSLWSDQGRLLATAKFDDEAVSGWQTVYFSDPVGLSSGSSYVASYHTTTGHYAQDQYAFAGGATVGHRSLIGDSGVYTYGSGGFPTDTWHDSDYFVDVIVDGQSGPSPTATPTQAPTTGSEPTQTPTQTPTPTPTTGSEPTQTSAPTTGPKPTNTSTSTSIPTTPPTTSVPVTKANCSDRPSSCGYPDASNTGVGSGVVLRKSGSVTASVDGQVISGLDIDGEINVTAKNVTVRDTRVTGGGDWVVIMRPGAENLTIEDSELMTPAGSPQDIACLLNIGDGTPTLLRVNIHGCSAGVSWGGGLVQDSYIHDMAQEPGLSHDVGVASNGSGGMRVVHNTIFNQFGQTAAVAFYQDFDVQRNDEVRDNLLGGGGYCVYGGTGGRGATSDIRFIGNRFSRKFSDSCGNYGPVADFAINDPGNQWTGNYWDDTLAKLPIQ